MRKSNTSIYANKKNVLLLLLCFVSLITLNGCNVLQENNLVQGSDLLQEWVGAYEMSESAPGYGSDVGRLYTVQIYKQGDNYYTDITILGFQMYVYMQAMVKGNEEKIDMFLIQYFDSEIPMTKYFKEGELLLSFKKEGKEMYTIWGAVQSIFPEQQTPGIYFQKEGEKEMD